MSFLSFAVLAFSLNIRVYSEVNAYARVLIALPFLAVIVAAEEEVRWRRWLLIGGVAFATLQGAFVLALEMRQSWHALQRGAELHQPASQVTGLRISGAPIQPRAQWGLGKGQRVSMAPLSGTRYIVLRVRSGEATVLRNHRKLFSLAPTESCTLAVRHGGRGLEVVGSGAGGAVLAPLTPAASSVPDLAETAWLAPVIVGTQGYGGTRWSTELLLRNDSAHPQRVRLVFLPRRADGRNRVWAAMVLGPGRELMLDDVVPALFGVRSAGALLVDSSDPLVSVRCKVGYDTHSGTAWVDAPVLTRAQVRAAAANSWSLAIPPVGHWSRLGMMIVNPSGAPARAEVRVSAGGRPLLNRKAQLDPWEVRHFSVGLGYGQNVPLVSVSGAPGRIPVGVVLVSDADTGKVALYWAGDQETRRPQS